MKIVEVNVLSITGNDFCVSVEDGKKVFEIIQKVINDGMKAEISFKNIDLITSAFLNAAIGDLYGIFEDDKLKKSLSVKEIKLEDKLLLKRVIDTAKLYYKDKKKFTRIVKESLSTK